MTINPDTIVLWEWGPIHLNATILWTWIVMALLVGGAWLATRSLSSGASISRRQHFFEVIVQGMQDQIREVSRQEPGRYLPFIGTLFIFIALSDVLTIVPGYVPPTGSLSTTTALAVCVFIAVPIYGITRQGLRSYFVQYLKPTWIMLPFNIFGEFSRILALAVRLYGNIMSGTVIVAILLSIAPLFFPVIMQALGLLIGLIQAYIFAILAMVYIASATQAGKQTDNSEPS